MRHVASPYPFSAWGAKEYCLPHPKTVDSAKETAKQQKSSKRYRIFFVLCLSSVALTFVELFLCVLLTGFRDITDFTKRDKTIFIAYIVMTLLTFAFLIVSVIFCRKAYFAADKAAQTLALVECYRHRNLDLYDNTCRVLFAFSQGHFIRAVVYEEEGNYAYSLQSFLPFLPPQSGSWTTYDRESGFSTPEEAESALRSRTTLSLEEEP